MGLRGGRAQTGPWAGELEEAVTSADNGAGKLEEAARASSYGATGNVDGGASELGRYSLNVIWFMSRRRRMEEEKENRE